MLELGWFLTPGTQTTVDGLTFRGQTPGPLTNPRINATSTMTPRATCLGCIGSVRESRAVSKRGQSGASCSTCTGLSRPPFLVADDRAVDNPDVVCRTKTSSNTEPRTTVPTYHNLNPWHIQKRYIRSREYVSILILEVSSVTQDVVPGSLYCVSHLLGDDVLALLKVQHLAGGRSRHPLGSLLSGRLGCLLHLCLKPKATKHARRVLCCFLVDSGVEDTRKRSMCRMLHASNLRGPSASNSKLNFAPEGRGPTSPRASHITPL